MTARNLLQLVSVALLSVSAKDFPAINAGDCDCFRTDGASETYFTNHLFFDFRSLSQHAGIPDLIDNENDTASAEVTSDYFSSDEWTNQWTIQAWNNSDTMGKDGSDATVLLVNSPNNVYIQANDDDDNTESSASDTYLTMRTSRLESFQSAAEMESTLDSYHFLSVRMYARTIGSSGACTAVFTYRDGVTTLADVQEADIEFLTAGPRDRAQYTNQPSFTVEGDEVKDATFNETLPLPMGEWAVHRMDWNPEQTVWYVDGEEVKRNSFQVPKDPSRVLFNAWSDGGSWSGEMEEGGEAFLQIQWIEMIYNSTGAGDDARKMKREEEQCDVVCSIDEADEVGGAVKLSSAAAPFGVDSMMPMIALWIASTLVGYL